MPGGEGGQSAEQSPSQAKHQEDASGADAVGQCSRGHLKRGVPDQKSAEDRAHLRLGQAKILHHAGSRYGDGDAADVTG